MWSMSETRPQGLGVLLALFGLLAAIIIGSIVWVFVNTQAGDPRPWGNQDVNGTVVTVKYTTTDCVDGSVIDVDEEATKVTLTLKVSTKDDCKTDSAELTEKAVLKQPLGTRELIDGACLMKDFRGDTLCADGSRRD